MIHALANMLYVLTMEKTNLDQFKNVGSVKAFTMLEIFIFQINV